jgi:hypothetical protein
MMPILLPTTTVLFLLPAKLFSDVNPSVAVAKGTMKSRRVSFFFIMELID